MTPKHISILDEALLGAPRVRAPGSEAAGASLRSGRRGDLLERVTSLLALDRSSSAGARVDDEDAALEGVVASLLLENVPA